MLKIIAAISENGVIGSSGQIPWHLPADMIWFKQNTGKEPVFMGRKTFESLPARFRPLPDRENIVLTRTPDQMKGMRVTAINSFDSVLERSRMEDIWVIGGAEIYRLSLPHTEMLYMTRVEIIVEGDVFFPPCDLREWELIVREDRPSDEKNKYNLTWEIYTRIQRPASP